MNVFPSEQRFEIADILRNDDAVFRDAAILDRMVLFAPTTNMKRMDSVVTKTRQVEGDFW